MWLWCVRNEDFDGATIWLTNAGDFSLVSADDSLTNVFTTLYLLEGMLLYIVCRIDQRNVRSVANAYKEVASLIASLEKIAQKVKIILPRSTFMLNFDQFLFDFIYQTLAFEGVLQIRKVCGQYNFHNFEHGQEICNKFSELFGIGLDRPLREGTSKDFLHWKLKNCFKLQAWSNNLPSISVDFWKEHCEPDNLLDYHEVDMNDGKLGQFTLPTPLYSI